MKRVIEVYGSFAGEPVIGERAVILQNGKPTHYTSEVAVIYKRTDQEIEFETKNSVYKVIYEESEYGDCI